jgi:transposase-like protein
MSKETVPKRQYIEEFRLEAVRLADSVGGHEAARRLGIPIATLSNWHRRRLCSFLARGFTPAPVDMRGGRQPTWKRRIAGFVRNWPVPGWTSRSSERQPHTSRRGRGEVCLD